MENTTDAVVEADPRRLSKVAVIRLGAPYTQVLSLNEFLVNLLTIYSPESGVSSILRFSVVATFCHGRPHSYTQRRTAN